MKDGQTIKVCLICSNDVESVSQDNFMIVQEKKPPSETIETIETIETVEIGVPKKVFIMVNSTYTFKLKKPYTVKSYD